MGCKLLFPILEEEQKYCFQICSVYNGKKWSYELEYQNKKTQFNGSFEFEYNEQNIGLVMDFIESTKGKKSVKGKKLNKFIQSVWEH